jgi:hypothetical protein
MAKDAAAVAADWAARLGQSTQKIEAGIRGVTQAPGAAAARQKTVWAQNVAQSQDKWARRVAAVTLQEWQDAAVTKGVGRIGAGAQAAIPKMQQFLQVFLPFQESIVNSLPPRGDLNANVNRMVQMVTKTAQFKR